LALLTIVFALVFPNLVHWGAGLLRRMFKLEQQGDRAGRSRAMLVKTSDGLDQTAEHFKALRKGGLATPLKIVGLTLLINVAFSTSLFLGFLAIGYVPVFWQILVFYSVLTIVFISALVFFGGAGAAELTAVAYWSYLTGLSISEIVVAMLAVKAWQFAEMTGAIYFLVRYISRLSKGEISALFKRKIPTGLEGSSE